MKEYIGDGVYVEINSCGVVLTTSDGYNTTNEIFLDTYTLKALVRCLKNNEVDV